MNPERSTAPAILRPKDAATYLGVTRRTVYELAETDPLFPRKIILTPRCVGWRRESLDAYIAAKEAGR